MSEIEARALARRINQQEQYWFARLYGLYSSYAVEVQHRPSGETFVLHFPREWPNVKKQEHDL